MLRFFESMGESMGTFRKCQNARLPVKERRFSAALGSTLFWQI